MNKVYVVWALKLQDITHTNSENQSSGELTEELVVLNTASFDTFEMMRRERWTRKAIIQWFGIKVTDFI